MTWKDPLVEEIRKIRTEIAAEHDFDFYKFSRRTLWNGATGSLHRLIYATGKHV